MLVLFLVLVAIGLCQNVEEPNLHDAIVDSILDLAGLEKHNASSKCHARLNECHTMSVVLGIMASGLLLINIATVIWFNRLAIRFFLSRWIPSLAPPQEEEDDDEEPLQHRHYDHDIIRFG